MHVSNDTTVLESRKEGKSFLELVAKRISEPDLAAELISAAARLVVASASAHGKENTPVTAATYAVAAPSDASLLVKFPGLSLVAPRGKFDVGFSPEALVLSNAKSSVVVPVAAITHVAVSSCGRGQALAARKGCVSRRWPLTTATTTGLAHY